jgi:hypothetical protein
VSLPQDRLGEQEGTRPSPASLEGRTGHLPPAVLPHLASQHQPVQHVQPGEGGGGRGRYRERRGHGEHLGREEHGDRWGHGGRERHGEHRGHGGHNLAGRYSLATSLQIHPTYTNPGQKET